MEVIITSNMPKSNGHYSQCIKHKDMLFLSGQLPIHPISKSIPDTIEAQADQALKNVELILTEAVSSKNLVIQMRIYLSDIALWDKVNVRYSLFFEDHKPVRSIISTRDLHFGCLIEIEATAILNN